MLYEYFIPFNDVFISSYSFKMFLRVNWVAQQLSQHYIDFNCTLLSEILSDKTDETRKDSDKTESPSSSIIPGPNSEDNDFTFEMQLLQP